jgi:hypothetical protein
MATLFGTKIQDTYDGLLKVTDNIGITGTKKFITDGLGVNSSVKISSLDFEVANFFFIDVLSGQDPSNYKVGINTSSPTQMLHVVGNMRLTGAFYDSNNATGTSGQILSSTTSGTDWVDITAIQTLSGSGTTNYLTKWTNNTVLGNSILYETSSKIGIGTITPSEKLHVDGNLALQGQINLMVVNEIYGIIKPEFAKINYYLDDGATTTGTPTITMSGDGHSRLGIGVASPDEALHVVGDALITGDSHADTFKPAVTANPIKFKNFASTELMRITDTGLVGIANNSPSYTLDVTGTARVSGDTYFVTQANSDDSNKVATTAYVKNLIEEIPAGLIFQGTWDASTNTPTLTSGSGTTGHFYIVSTDGSTNLDGITDWKVGDWAVFVEQGVTDQWEKIDNSSVLDGFGTGGTITAWAGSGTSNTLTNSPITFSGNDVSFAGDITVSGNQFFNGEFIEGDGKEMFRYTDGWLRINEDNDFGSGIYCGTGLLRTDGEFQVGGSGQYAKITSTGAATFAGDITSAGLTVDYTGNRTGDAGILVTNDNSDWGIKVDKDGTTDYGILSQTDGENAIVVRNAAGVNKIQLQGDGDATFAGDIYGNDRLYLATKMALDVNGTDLYLGSTTNANHNDTVYIRTNNANRVTITDATATFTGNVQAASYKIGGVTVLQGTSTVTVGSGGGTGKVQLNTTSGVGLILDGNRVGIGTTSPDGNLEVITSTIVSGASDTVNNVLIGLQAANRPTIILDTADTTYTNRTWNITNVGSAGKLFIGRNGLDVMVMDNSGKIGIGTESPSRNLQVKGTANTAIAITSSTSSLAQLALGDTDDDNYAQIILDNSTNKLQIQNGGGGIISNRGITLDSSENVGIGTDSPTEKLEVNGRIKVQTSSGSLTLKELGTSSATIAGSGTVGIEAVGNFRVKTNTSNEVLTVLSTARVGIGTTLPKTSLDIVKNSDIWHLMVGGLTKKLLVGGQAASGDVVLQAGAASTANNAAVTTAYNLCLQRDGGNVGVGNANPQSKLQVAGGIQMANDTDTASASKVGTLKYYTSGNNSYVDMCMQTGATTYEWINIVQNNW